MSEHHVARPGGITLLMVLGVIQGLLSAGFGVFLVLDRDDADLQEVVSMTSAQLSGTGVGLIVAGTILLLLAVALGRGSSIVRWLFGIVTMLNVGFGIWGLFSLHGEQQLTAALQVVWGLIILWILFGSERTDRFFANG